ncbi:ATP-dependent DNA helicase RecQ [Saonia flava]|uniref:ATP-dependent DNA helicase RecQ n=1 Tax=Saonia flava TaxID=523696 RepID=A0A846QQ18_9FLAO|nr:RecQ family ATP-dependent DNA helicase [Saonia flava]NJB70181.1 ATP-dependent DNA helicase RecQ [Saonia flava]
MHTDPKDILLHYWGFSAFKSSQEKVIDAVMNNDDVLALLPTGGGKSICYQIPAIAKEGICVVVSPLVALIQNQVDGLKQKGIKAIALTGGISHDEIIDLLDNCLYGKYKFLYLSPERLEQDIVKDKIRQMNVNLIAIDEAHCISQWGNDFRPAYLNCHILRELAPEASFIALTATATAKVAKDIVENLKFIAPVVIKNSFSRENISFNVIWEEDKRYKLKLLCSRAEKSSIVYVRSRRLAEEISTYLNQHNNKASFFHGGMTKKEKEKTLHNWLENKTKVMVATNAFGMGIDKSDVEMVIHYQIPDSIEDYYQEAGRAGRNGQPSKAILITNTDDERLVQKQFLSVLPDVSFIKLLYQKLSNYFQIAYGEGHNETFQFRFNDFCNTYKLNSILTYNGLRLLDQNSVLALSETFSKKTTIQFIASKNVLFEYLESNKTNAPIIQTILRTYGGLFEYATKINTLLISKKTGVEEVVVFKVLEQLKKDEVIEYQSQQGDLEITFLVPREDERTINRFSDKIVSQRQLKIDNVNSMLNYVKDNNECRSIQLLRYFGEKRTKRCGICDVCTKDKKPNKELLNTIEKEIVAALGKKHSSSRELISSLNYDEGIILTIIQNLLENELISINTKNEYQLR